MSRRAPSYRDLLAGNVAFKLPLRFDARSLARDLAALPKDAWKLKTYNVRDAYSHDGSWASLTLRGPRRRRRAGRWNQLTSGPFADYPVFKTVPRLKKTVDAFPGEKTGVFLFKLAPGGAVTRHTDPLYRYKGREMVPVHVVLTTNPGASIVINGRPVRMRAGEVWAINATLPHEVYNAGGRERVHLLLNMLYDEDVARLFSLARKLQDGAADASGRYAGRFLDALARRGRVSESSRRTAAVVAQFLRLQARPGRAS